MRKTRKQNRWLALALCLCMLASVFPLSGMTYAAEQGCNHVHDENCGYVEAVEGQPCTFAHAHDDTCGFAEAVEALPCSVEAAHTSHDETCGGDPDTGEGCAFAHVHDDACGYAEAKESAPCSAEAAHIHDENCGYIEAVKGQPCTHVHDETCGGLAQDSGPVPCTKTEGCTLEDGHEGECDADSSFSLFSNTDAILEVTFDSNLYGGMPGGLDSISNAMNTAVATALTTGKDKTAITTIRLTGSATEITGWNWCYLMELYQGSEWPNLSVLDLSGMTSLDKIENRTGGSPYSLISNLTEVRFPASLQTIGTSAFYWCKGLTSVSFPTGLETIGNNAFYSCDKLESAPFPASLQTIGAAAFSECSKLNSADLSGCQNLEGIPSAAFSGCSSLNAVSFPASLKTIGDSAFSGCSNLNALTFLGNKPPDTGTKAFLDVASDGGIVYPAASSGFTDEWKNNTLGADWTLTATGGIAPAFSVHPADQSKNAGETAVFSVTATGAPAPSYQWQESTNSGATWTDITDGGIYSGAATATLTLIGVRATHNGYQYRCVVSNMVQAGVQSNAATLTVTGSVIKATVNLAGHDTFKSAVTAANIFDVTAVTSLAVTGQTNGGTWRTTDREYLKAQFTSLTELDLSGYTGEFSSSAFEGCTQLAKVTMPTGSYAVSEYMFYNCKALKDIDVSGATSFGERAFFGCTSLTDVTMPTGSYAVPEFMFQNCTALKDIDVSGATSFGERAFSGCASLTDVTMPTGSYAVSEYVFQNCTALKDIDVSGATSFGNNAFDGCTSLTDVTMPTGGYAVSEYVFQNCTALKDIDVSGATSFGNNAFNSCTSLTDVKLPGSYAVSDSMFYYCTALKDIDVSGATSFGNNAFNSCTSLTDVKLPGSYAVSDSMFYYCKALKDIDVSGATSFGNSAFTSCVSLTDVKLPGSYTVSESMFWGCTALKDIDVSGATSFGNNAFDSCTSLTDVKLPSSYAVPKYMFSGCKALKDIDVSGATSFGNNAFGSCTSLTDVKLPGSYAVSVSMFERCTALKDIDVSGATSFGWNAFKGCTQLANVKLPGSYAMSESMFQNCTALKDIDVSGATSFDSNVFKGCTSLKTVKLSGGLSIPQSMFLNCAALETLAFMSGTAPSSVGTNAFLYVPISGTVYHPTGQNGYDTAFNGTNVENWRFISTDYSAAPSISIPPTDQSKKAGETAVFSVTATGDPSPGYQWQVSADSGATWTDITDGGIYSGATTRELTLAGVQTSHNGYQYRCVVSNILLLAGVESGAATLTVTGGSTGGGDPTPSTYSLTVRAGTGGKITQGASGNYEARKTISIEAKADAGYKFTGWTSSNGGGFANSGSISTTFIMPANATTVTATFQKKDPGPSGPDYTWQTLIDHPSGVRVSGLFTDDAKLEVKEMLLHLQGDCPVCDNIRERQENGELIVLFDIALKSGKYKGDLDVEIPVGGQYNGQSIVIIHCKDKVLDSRTVTVENGMAKGAFSSLSPYAAAKVSGKTVITGLPESYTLLAGQSVSWTPSPAGGAWSYDTDLLEMTRQGDTYTFKALKEGKATATYTVDGVPFTVTIAVNSSIIPQTGDVSNPWPWTLLATAALLGCAALVLVRRGGYKKRHG